MLTLNSDRKFFWNSGTN